MRGPTAAAAGLVTVVWGLCFVLVQASLPSPTPLLLAGLRAVLGGAMLGAWAGSARWSRWRRRPVSGEPASGAAGPRRPGLPSIPILIALALANAGVAFGAMYLAAGRAEAAVASILAGGQPVLLAGAGWVLFGERASGRGIAGLAAAMAGVALVATQSSAATSLDGVALAIVATAAPAAGTVVMRRLGSSIDVIATTAAQFLLGGLALIGTSAVLEPWAEVRWSPGGLAGLLVLGVLGTGFAYGAWFWLVGRMSFLQLGTALFLVPVVGVVAGILAGDRPSTAEIAGIVAVLAGIGIIASRAPLPAPDR